MRDQQKQRVFEAERAAFDGGWYLKPEACNEYTENLTLDECRAYVRSITKTRWWLKRGRMQVRVGDGRSRRSAAADIWRHEIRLPRIARMRWVILHELAHILANVVYSSKRDIADHGTEFCQQYLALVARFMGKDQKNRLKGEFRTHRVKFIPRVSNEF